MKHIRRSFSHVAKQARYTCNIFVVLEAMSKLTPSDSMESVGPGKSQWDSIEVSSRKT